jgi:hypothetical protein
MYYAYARLTLEGEKLDRIYDETYFNAKIREFGFDLQDRANNAPSAGLAYLPVAWLSPPGAKIAWCLLSLAALGYALKVLFDVCAIRPAGPAGLWLLTLVFAWRPLYDTLAYGQVYIVMLLLFALSMKGVLRENTAGTAAPLALAIVLKGYGGVPVLLLALRRRWKEIALAVLIAGSVILATLPLLGPASWWTFAGVVLPSIGSNPSDGHVAYQTVNGFIRHLCMYDPLWLPHPVFPMLPFVVALLSYGGSVGVAGFVLYRSPWRSPAERVRSYAAAIGAGVVTAPLAEEYHFVLFIPLVFVLASDFTTEGGAREWKGAAARFAALAVLVMAAPLNYKSLQFASFPAVLLAYPKLYAGLVLLWYSCRPRPGCGGGGGVR